VLIPLLLKAKVKSYISPMLLRLDTNECLLIVEEKKESSILDSLPGNSGAAKAAYLTTGAGLATFLISKEIYILNEETLVLVGAAGLLGVLLKYLREPFTTMGNEHINVSKSGQVPCLL
jgi:hypothetical protein